MYIEAYLLTYKSSVAYNIASFQNSSCASATSPYHIRVPLISYCAWDPWPPAS